MSITRTLVVLTAMVVLVAALAPASAWAPVAPRNCGMLEANGKRFNIKADAIRCTRARRYARAYLEQSSEPRGYSCRDYGRGTSIEVRCSKGSRVFFAIRR